MIKLIKYDLKSILPDFAGFYIALILLAAMFPLFMELSSLRIILVLYFLTGFGVLVTIGVLTYAAIFNLFYKRLFSHQGYLTLSLPVSTRKLLLSKIISSAVLITITTTVVFISFLASLASSSLVFGFDWNLFYSYLEIAQSMNAFAFFGRVFAAITPISLTSTLYSLTLVLFILTFVHTSFIRKNRILVGVLSFVGISIIVNRISSFLFGISPLAQDYFQIRAHMGSNFDFNTIQMPWLNIGMYSVLYILLSVGLFELARYLIERKLEVE